jgi:hypothetical protein
MALLSLVAHILTLLQILECIDSVTTEETESADRNYQETVNTCSAPVLESQEHEDDPENLDDNPLDALARALVESAQDSICEVGHAVQKVCFL